ncbi:hypothetical protein ACPV5O_03485 [Vibrio maritimus]|uniref:hypothetical protein n=1 Tax=Vibrio maritimus TaxID=990268 RepID=UPI0040692ACE
MNKTVLSSLVVATMALVGCNDTSTTESPVLQGRMVSVNTVLANVSEMNALTNTCLRDVQLPEPTNKLPEFENNVCAIEDLDGNVHFVRTSDYDLTVTDIYGPKTYPITDIIDGMQEVEVFGEATFKVSPQRLEGEDNQFYSYYLVEGEQDLPQDERHVEIKVDNTEFSYVTFTVAEREDLDFYHTTITEAREEPKNFGATRTHVEGDVNIYETHAYRYIKKDSEVLITAYNGSSYVETIDFEPVTHYDFGELKIDPKSGDIIITPPDFGEPIEIIPTPVAPVIKPSQVDNAELVRFDENGYGIFSTIANKRGEAEPWLYPELKFENGLKSLKTFDFSYQIEESNGFATFMNIYLLDDDILVRAVYYPSNEKTIEEYPNGYVSVDGGEVISKERFIEHYGDYKLAARTDGIRFNTNFIVRVADDNTEEGLEFTVKDFTVKQLPASITQEQLVGGTILDSNIDDTTSVDVEIDGNKQSSTHNPLWIYTNTKFPAKDTDAPTLSQISVDVDVEVSDNFANKAASDSYINIYLDGWSATETFALYVSGDNKGQVIQRTHRSGESQEVYANYEAFQSAYADTKVRGVTEGLKLNTNFMLRFGDNDNGPYGDDLTGEKVTINKFEVTITENTNR